MKVGIFGGTFDPPHVGHLLAASDAFDVLGLERVVFVPNARQPLKADVPQSSPADRLAMVRLSVSGDDRFAVDPIEVERGGTSYSVDTLESMAERAPGDERFFLVGADASRTFSQWREPHRIAELARIAVMQRSGGDGEGEGPAAMSDGEVRAALSAVVGAAAAPPIILKSRRVDVSSSEIRDRVREGRSIHGFVPDAVARFIHERGLYR